MILTKGKIKEFNIELFTEGKISSNQLDSLLIIVPTNRRQRNLKKNIIDNFKEKPVSIINIETISSITEKLLLENMGFTSLSEAASTVLIRESAESLELSYFAAYSKGIPFGTLDKIKNVISEYKKNVPRIFPKLFVFNHENEMNVKPNYLKALKSETSTLRALISIPILLFIIHMVK